MKPNESASAEQALAYTVVELGSRVASSYAGKLLAELGARVVKVEPAAGDPLRHQGDAALAQFAYLHGSKSSIALDLSLADGRATLQRLIAEADLLIDGLAPGELADLGVDLDQTRLLAVLHVSDFGQTGPYVGFPSSALTVQAAGGWVIDRGQANHIPVQVGGDVHEYTAGVYGAGALLTEARAARADGARRDVDLSVSATLLAAIPFQEDSPGTDPVFIDLATRPFPMTIVPAKDGWVGLNCLTGQQWQDACAMVGAPEYAGRREELRADRELLAEFTEKVTPWFASHTVSEVVELAQAFRIPTAPLGNAERLLGEPHFVEREVFIDNHAGDVEFRQPRPPYRLSRTPARVRRGLPTPAEVR